MSTDIHFKLATQTPHHFRGPADIINQDSVSRRHPYSSYTDNDNTLVCLKRGNQKKRTFAFSAKSTFPKNQDFLDFAKQHFSKKWGLLRNSKIFILGVKNFWSFFRPKKSNFMRFRNFIRSEAHFLYLITLIKWFFHPFHFCQTLQQKINVHLKSQGGESLKS